MKLADRYALGEAIGEGGMGTVVRARDERLGRDVAVKILPPERIGDRVARERLVREARAAASLEHPGIVHVYDVGETEDGGAFLVMELVNGASLRDAIARGATAGAILRWIVAAARALAFAHGRGILHRDVKPDNVMVRDDGRVVVLDFGLAKPVAVDGADAKLTEEGVLVGTPAYFAPEQAEGRALDATADQFALAVTAYEALTGRLPWKGESAAQVIASLLRDDPKGPSAVARGLPKTIDAPILRALAKGPADRFPTMDAFADALAEAAKGITDTSAAAFAPTETISKSSVTPTRTQADLAASARPPARSRAWTIAAALGGVAAFVAVAMIAHRAAAPSAAPLVTAPLDAADLALPVAMSALPIPPSSVPEAMAAYREGMQAYGDGSVPGARAAFEKAIDRDAQYTAAHFRLGDIALGQGDLTTARRELAAVMGQRAQLGAHERGILEIDEPLALRSPPDFAEARARSKRFADAEPYDTEYRATLAYVELTMHDDAAALEDARRASALDPQLGSAYMLAALALVELGRSDEADATYGTCIERVPTALACLYERFYLASDRGDCTTAAAIAERSVALSPDLAIAYALRTNALLATGAPRATTEEALEQAASRRAGAMGEVVKLSQREGIAVAFGDFAAVIKMAPEVERSLEKTMDLAYPARHALVLAEAYAESGRPKDAARVAAAYFAKRDLWIANGVTEGAGSDATPQLVALERKAGAMSAGDAKRALDAFVARWSELDRAEEGPARIWLAASRAATTRAEAEDALAHRPAARTPSLASNRAQLGELNRLAGRLDEAMPLLESGARACAMADAPLDHVIATMHLAEAREAKGDAAGACAAYGEVLARWGEAKPKSLTADAARARRKALGCK